jgi:hypothetical protein
MQAIEKREIRHSICDETPDHYSNMLKPRIVSESDYQGLEQAKQKGKRVNTLQNSEERTVEETVDT